MGRIKAAGGAGILMAALMLTGCDSSAPPAVVEEQAYPVETITVVPESLSLSSELPGRVEPIRMAEVRARVSGIVIEKHFVEGSNVEAGDVLFQIDPAPLEAAVARAEGELARAQAARQEAQARVERYKPLVRIDAVSRQDFDVAAADLASAKASVRTTQADLKTARLNLSYATVTAPISGRIGRALVTEGALVSEGSATLMARIQQLDPVYVDFTQSVTDTLRLRQALNNGELGMDLSEALGLQVQGLRYQRKGELLFADASVDRGTGQVSLRGKFDNTDRLLMPGMYVRVTVPQGRDDEAILVPQRAVIRAVDGSAQVLVVTEESRAEARAIKTGVMQGGRWQIRQGLHPGDQVIVGGLSGLKPGTEVEVREHQDQRAQQLASRH